MEELDGFVILINKSLLLKLTVVFLFQLWSRVNTCIIEHESNITMPRLASLVKLLVWSQDQLDKKKVKYPKMSDIAQGSIADD